MNRLKKYRQLTQQEKKLFREVLTNAFRIKLLLTFYSFKKLSKKYKSRGDKKINEEEILQLKIAISRAHTLMIWKNKCLVDTLVVRHMLNKRDISSQAYLGVRKNEKGKLIAHAWITSNSLGIIPKEHSYVELYTF